MSTTFVSVERISEVKPHPNADRLDIIKVLGYHVVTGKGNFKIDDLAVYFPPDILIPESIAEELGVAQYLKHAIYPGDIHKTQCRVGATRLRGTPSYGFCVPATESRVPAGTPIGADVSDLYRAKKYQPPVRGAGDQEVDMPNFHHYTNIENIQRYPDAIKENEHVVITEKIHGTNCRMGYVQDHSQFDPTMIYVAGSHRVRRKNGTGLYWEFMDDNVKDCLKAISEDNDNADVILFGEIFGQGIQDMDYGQPAHAFRAFDISVDGAYLDHPMFIAWCDEFGIDVVPILYQGPFTHEIAETYTDGPTRFNDVKCGFKGREGVVIKPWLESHSDILGKRKILKSVSVDYLSRRGAKDIGE